MHRLRRALPMMVGLLLVGLAAFLAAAPTYRPVTELWDFVSGIKIGKLSGLSQTGGTLTIGGTDVTAVQAKTAGGTTAIPPTANSVTQAMTAGFYQNLIFCGDDAGGTTTNYLGPALPPAKGDGSASYAIGSSGCKSLDSTTEATADAPFSTLALAVKGMRCVTTATLAAGESMVYTLRTAAADTVPVISCTIGVGATECRTNTATTTNIVAGATLAVKVAPTGDNAAADAWCVVTVVLP